MSSARTIAVVGGGMLGLTLALRFREAGWQVTLLESATEIGGLASSWHVGKIRWDRHYHVVMLSDKHTRKLLAELGLEEDMRWVVTRTGCYSQGSLYSFSDALDFLRFPLLGRFDKARLALTILAASRIKNWRALEQVRVGEWLSRWSGRRTYERFWLPLLRSKLGDGYQITSAAFIWSTIQRLYAARRTGLKREMFGYVPGGYARVLETLGERLTERGIELRLGCGVKEIRTTGTQLTVDLADGTQANYDRVIVTAAAPVAAKLAPCLSDAERSRLGAIDYLGIVCASVVLDRPLGGYYVTNITDEGFPFTGVIEMTALVDPREFGGSHLIYLPRYLAPGDRFGQKTDSEIEAEFLDGLRRMHPDLHPDAIQAIRISRVRYVMPIPTLGYSEKVSPFHTSVPELYLVNSSQITNGTLNVNETLALAERAARALLTPADHHSSHDPAA